MKINYLNGLAIVFASLCYAEAAQAQQNLLTVNPGFESGKTGWYLESKTTTTNEISSAQAHSGSTSLRLVSVVGGGEVNFFTEPKQQQIALQAGKNYKLELWVKPVVQTRGISLKVYATSGGFKAASDIRLEYSGKKLKLGEWQLVTFDFTANDYPAAKFLITASLGELYLDDLKLYEVK